MLTTCGGRLVSIKQNLHKIDQRVRTWLRSEGSTVSEDANLQELTRLAEDLQLNKSASPARLKDPRSTRRVMGLGVEPGHSKDRMLTDEYLLMFERLRRDPASSTSNVADNKDKKEKEGVKDMEIPGRAFVAETDVADQTGKHSILGLSDESFSKNSVSDMIRGYQPTTTGNADSKVLACHSMRYGWADVGDQELSCEDDFGMALVERWRVKRA
eukprot:429950-Hanusia_phi.AAC.1